MPIFAPCIIEAIFDPRFKDLLGWQRNGEARVPRAPLYFAQNGRLGVRAAMPAHLFLKPSQARVIPSSA